MKLDYDNTEFYKAHLARDQRFDGSMRKFRGIGALPEDATYDEMDSPVGILTIITSLKGLHAIFWDNDRTHLKCKALMDCLKRSPNEVNIVKVKKQLNEYFQGTRKSFDLPIVIDGTQFQNQAWGQLLKIPYGTTIAYKTQAERLGDKNKARAVGMANGQNPISIVIPCHRVVGSTGKLVGFGGGLDKKDYLLKLEQQYL